MSSAEAAVLAAARQRAAALAAGDAGELSRLLHPEFHWTTHVGQVFDRDAYVDRNTTGTTTGLGQDLVDTAVDVVDTVAVLRAIAVDVVETDRGPETFTMRMTQVWVLSDGHWRCLAGHAGPHEGAGERGR